MPSWEELQEIHELRQLASSEHDRGGCWCCCIDCPDPDDDDPLVAPAAECA